MFDKPLKSIFDDDRDDTLHADCVRYARWTIADLYPDVSGDVDYKTVVAQRDLQSFLTQMAMHLATKVCNAMFPTSVSFFKTDMNQEQKDMFMSTLSRATQMKVHSADVETLQATTEKDACQKLFEDGNLARLTLGCQYLVCLGNCLFVRETRGRVLAYSTRYYSIKRDATGRPVRVVLKERQLVGQLPPKVRAGVGGGYKPDDHVDVFTGVYWNPPDMLGKRTVMVCMECGEYKEILQTALAEEVCPYIPASWALPAGASYGVGHVARYAGDCSKYSSLSRALALYEVAACKVVHGVKPGTGTDLDSLENAETGEYVLADPDGVKALEFGNGPKIAEMRNDLQAIEERLARAFQWTGNLRDAERVTAQEVVLTARQIDQDFGGEYSALSAELHPKFAMLLLQDVQPAFVIGILAGEMGLKMLTGIPALARSAKVQAILEASQEAAAIIAALAPTDPRISPQRILEMCLAARGVDINDLYKTEEELQAEAQAAAPISYPNPQDVTAALQGVA